MANERNPDSEPDDEGPVSVEKIRRLKAHLKADHARQTAALEAALADARAKLLDAETRNDNLSRRIELFEGGDTGKEVASLRRKARAFELAGEAGTTDIRLAASLLEELGDDDLVGLTAAEVRAILPGGLLLPSGAPGSGGRSQSGARPRRQSDPLEDAVRSQRSFEALTDEQRRKLTIPRG